MAHCGKVSPSVDVPHFQRGSLGGCVSVWEKCAPGLEGVSQCRRLYPIVGGSAPVREGVP